MSRRNTYIVIKLVPGGIEYLTRDGRGWESRVTDASWRGTKPEADALANQHPGSQVDRLA